MAEKERWLLVMVFEMLFMVVCFGILAIIGIINGNRDLIVLSATFGCVLIVVAISGFLIDKVFAEKGINASKHIVSVVSTVFAFTLGGILFEILDSIIPAFLLVVLLILFLVVLPFWKKASTKKEPEE